MRVSWRPKQTEASKRDMRKLLRHRRHLTFSVLLGLLLLSYGGISVAIDLLHNHHDLPVTCRPSCPACQWYMLSQDPSLSLTTQQVTAGALQLAAVISPPAVVLDFQQPEPKAFHVRAPPPA